MSEHEDLIARYAAAPQQLEAVLDALQPGALDRAPGQGEWTARQIVIHLADSEIMAGVRFRLLLAQDEPTFPLYQQARWAEEMHYATADAAAVAEAVQLFTHLRTATTRLLRHLPADRWDRAGTHPERGRMTVRDLLALYADHAEGHLRQMRRAAGLASDEIA